MFQRLRDTLAIQGLAVYGILVGITIIGLYSWSVSRYQSAIPNCGNINISNVTLCKSLGKLLTSVGHVNCLSWLQDKHGKIAAHFFRDLI